MRHAAFLLVAFGALTALSCSRITGPVPERVQQFRHSLPRASMTVYSSVVRTPLGMSHDLPSAEELAKFFGLRGARSQPSPHTVALVQEPSSVQTRMFRRSEEAFRKAVRLSPPPTRYAAITEFLVAGGGEVSGIHLFVVNRAGDSVYRAAVNSHHEEWKRVKPRTVPQATHCLLVRLNQDLPVDR